MRTLEAIRVEDATGELKVLLTRTRAAVARIAESGMDAFSSC
jgi:hypothetical protein